MWWLCIPLAPCGWDKKRGKLSQISVLEYFKLTPPVERLEQGYPFFCSLFTVGEPSPAKKKGRERAPRASRCAQPPASKVSDLGSNLANPRADFFFGVGGTGERLPPTRCWLLVQPNQKGYSPRKTNIPYPFNSGHHIPLASGLPLEAGLRNTLAWACKGLMLLSKTVPAKHISSTRVPTAFSTMHPKSPNGNQQAELGCWRKAMMPHRQSAKCKNAQGFQRNQTNIQN